MMLVHKCKATKNLKKRQKKRMHNTKGKQKYFGKMESLGGAQIFCEEQRCYWIDQNLRAYSSDKQIYVTNKLLIDHKKSSESKKAKRI